MLTLTGKYRRRRLAAQNGHSPNSPLTRGNIYTTGCDQGLADVVMTKPVIGYKIIWVIKGDTLLANFTQWRQKNRRQNKCTSCFLSPRYSLDCCLIQIDILINTKVCARCFHATTTTSISVYVRILLGGWENKKNPLKQLQKWNSLGVSFLCAVSISVEITEQPRGNTHTHTKRERLGCVIMVLIFTIVCSCDKL